MDYNTKSYGRNAEIASLFHAFAADRDISMPSPRRLGKTFLLERLAEAALDQNYLAIKVDLAACTDRESAFRELSAESSRVLFNDSRRFPQKLKMWVSQQRFPAS